MPIRMLEELLDAEDFDDWCTWHRWYPLDDQSNHHLPVANLHAAFLNANSTKGSKTYSFRDCLLFGGAPDDDGPGIFGQNWTKW